MKREEFEALVKEIGRGAALDGEELVEALGYAGSAWYEIQQLTKSLCAGYRAILRDNERKNQKIEVYIKMCEALRQENKRLREQIETMKGGNDNAEGL